MNPTPYLDDIPVDHIQPNPDNPRKNLGELEALAASIREQGILEPLVVEVTSPTDEPAHTYQLIAGHRRLAAAKRAGLTTVPAVVHTDPSTRADRIERMLVENLQREDLTPIEEGETFQLLLDLPDDAHTIDTIARRIGRPKAHVKERVKAAGLPESTRERILRGQITLEQSAKIAAFAKDKAELARINRAAEAGPLALATALEEAKRRQELKRAHTRQVRELRTAGVTVLEPTAAPDDALDLDEIPDVWPTFGQVEQQRPETTFGLDDYEPAALAIALERHTECPGHAAYVTDPAHGEPETHYLCTRPDLHASSDDAVEADGGDEEGARGPGHDEDAHGVDIEAQEAERAEREQREAEARRRADLQLRLDARAVVRRQFLHDVIHDEDAAGKLALERQHEILVNRIKGGALLSRGPREAFARILLPNISDAVLADPKATRDRIVRALDGKSLATTTLLLDLLDDMGAETELTVANPYPGSTWHRDKWVKKLTTRYGYELGAAERDILGDEESA